ncbi:MAG: UDP binding domain-containing protein [Pseudomonadota bacterium]|nr:UDP binding domain-containing protein [Pseudomonadota bacterium]
MGIFLADHIHEKATNILKKKRLRILILGFTFKENIKDLRNTKVVDIVKRLKRFGNQVEVHDYMADSATAYRDYQIRLKNEKLNQRRAKKFDCIIGAVEHSLYKKITWSNLSNFLKREAVIFDLKGMWRKLKIPKGIEKIEL